MTAIVLGSNSLSRFRVLMAESRLPPRDESRHASGVAASGRTPQNSLRPSLCVFHPCGADALARGAPDVGPPRTGGSGDGRVRAQG